MLVEGSDDLADAMVHALHHLPVGFALVGAGSHRIELAVDGSLGGIRRSLKRIVRRMVRE